MPAAKRSFKQRAEAAKRDAEVLRLRESGATFQEIHEQIGVSPSTAHGIESRYLQELKELGLENIDRARSIDLQRLDKMLLGVWGKATTGNLGAIEKTLRIMERRAKLLGLDQTLPDGLIPQLTSSDVAAMMARRAEILSGTKSAPSPNGSNGAGGGE